MSSLEVRPLTLAEVSDPVFQARFWGKVKTSGHCWEWQGAKKEDGYGIVMLNGRQQRTHRVSYVTAYLYLPPRSFVLHTCDNPSCVNPLHLYAGSKADNNSDTRTRARFSCKNSIIDDETVVAMRQSYANGATARELEEMFGFSRHSIVKIVTGQRRKDVGGPLTFRVRRRDATSRVSWNSGREVSA